MKIAPQAQSTLIIAAVVLFLLWYLKNRAGEAAQAVGDAVNPTKDTNLINRFAEWAYDGGADGQGTPGTDFADWMGDSDRWWN